MLNVLIILNFFARDNHELGRSGRLKQILTRTFDGVVVTEMLKLLGGIMIEFPVLMTVLALLLAYSRAHIGVRLFDDGHDREMIPIVGIRTMYSIGQSAL